jgi:hypothetical protein
MDLVTLAAKSLIKLSKEICISADPDPDPVDTVATILREYSSDYLPQHPTERNWALSGLTWASVSENLDILLGGKRRSRKCADYTASGRSDDDDDDFSSDTDFHPS